MRWLGLLILKVFYMPVEAFLQLKHWRQIQNHYSGKLMMPLFYAWIGQLQMEKLFQVSKKNF